MHKELSLHVFTTHRSPFDFLGDCRIPPELLECIQQRAQHCVRHATGNQGGDALLAAGTRQTWECILAVCHPGNPDQVKRWLDMSQFSKKWLDMSQFSKKSDERMDKDKKWLDMSQFSKKDAEKKWLDNSHFAKRDDEMVEKKWLDMSQFAKKAREHEKKWLDMSQFSKKEAEKKWLDNSHFAKKEDGTDKKWLDMSQFAKKEGQGKRWLDMSQFSKKWLDVSQFSKREPGKRWLDAAQFTRKRKRDTSGLLPPAGDQAEDAASPAAAGTSEDEKKWVDASHYNKKWLDVSQFAKKNPDYGKKWLDMAQFTKKWLDNSHFTKRSDDDKDKKWLDMSQFSKKDSELGDLEKKWLDNSHFTKKNRDEVNALLKRWLDVSQFEKKGAGTGELDKKWLDMSQFKRQMEGLEKKWLDAAQFSKKWLDNSHFAKKWIDSSNFAKKNQGAEGKRALPKQGGEAGAGVGGSAPSPAGANECVLHRCVGIATLEGLMRCALECRKSNQGNHQSQALSPKQPHSPLVGDKIQKKWVDPLAYGYDKKRSRDVYQRLRQCYWTKCNGHLSDAKCIDYCATDLAYLLEL